MNDTSIEIRRLQHELVMRLSVDRRFELASEMFMAARRLILASIPSALSERERKSALYEMTYGKKLPDDFFK